tara:strand:+ start:1820 stop:2026 length:207 start_codon:yes stop_codon:yes gene_type:complete
MFRPSLASVFLTIILLAVGNNINYSLIVRLISEEIVSSTKKNNKYKFFNDLQPYRLKNRRLYNIGIGN